MSETAMNAWDAISERERDDVARVTALFDSIFPVAHEGGRVVIERLAEHRARVRIETHPSQIRPGNTISGPTMFKLADVCIYVSLLHALGERAIQSATTNLSINFMRRSARRRHHRRGADHEARQTLAFGEVDILAEGSAGPDGIPPLVAHATATYAIPSA
jgi:acyl-coenzyme A thioesterase PaaI-like protein